MLRNNKVKMEVIRSHLEGDSATQIAKSLEVSISSITRFLRGDTYTEWWEENPELRAKIVAKDTDMSEVIGLASDDIKVLLIEDYLEGMPNKELTKKYRLTHSVISNFLAGGSYREWWDKNENLEEKVRAFYVDGMFRPLTDSSKLGEDSTKLAIVKERLSGKSYSDIARKSSLSKSALSRFLRGETHVEWWEENPELRAKIDTFNNNYLESNNGSIDDVLKLKIIDKFIEDTSASYEDLRNYFSLASSDTIRRFIIGATYTQWWERNPELRAKVDEAIENRDNDNSSLTPEMCQEIANLHERSNGDLTHAYIAEMYGVGVDVIYKFLSRRSYKEWWANDYKPLMGGDLEDIHSGMRVAKGHTFILTSAQNNTHVHKDFLKSLENAAKHLDATIIIGTFSYNRNGFQRLQKGEGDWFDRDIVEYIVDEPVRLADGLIWCGELNILPTAVNPLSGFQSYTGNSSGIIPHAKVQLESYPTIEAEETKFMYTTGAVTQRNYIQKTAGQKASFHHIFGALIVEVDDDGDWFVRQVSADTDTGIFQDLDVLYTPDGVIEGQTVEGINWGDIHADSVDPEAAFASFLADNPQNMLDVLKPKYQFANDVFDMGRRNHHNRRDYHYMFELYHAKKDNVEGEVEVTSRLLGDMHRDFSQIVVVNSNHDRALQRWLNETCYRSDFTNSVYFLRLQLEVYKAIERGDKDFSIFEYAIREKLEDNINIRFLALDESFKICEEHGGIECGMHGDMGANGSRGSMSSFRRLGSRINTGHTHSCAIMDGVFIAGTLSLLRMGYNRGPSSWSHSNIVTYPNGKRSIITIKNGKWRKDRGDSLTIQHQLESAQLSLL